MVLNKETQKRQYHRRTFVPTTMVRIRDTVRVLSQMQGPIVRKEGLLERLRLLGISRNRANELKNSARQMGLIEESGDLIIIKRSLLLLSGDSLSLEELWTLLNQVIDILGERREFWFKTRTRYENGGKKLHQFFMCNLPQYRKFVGILEEAPRNLFGNRGLTRDEIEEISKRPSETGEEIWLNNVANKLGDLAEYCGTISYNMFYWEEERLSKIKKKPREYTQERYYVLREDAIGLEQFAEHLERRYPDLLSGFGSYGLRSGYLEVPILREFVCEDLQLHREDFDKNLETLWENNLGRYIFARSTKMGEKYPSVASILQLEGPNGTMKRKLGVAMVRGHQLLPITIDGDDFFYFQIVDRG